jgi:hypothetical protein
MFTVAELSEVVVVGFLEKVKRVTAKTDHVVTDSQQYLHMDVVESDKMQWMKDVPQCTLSSEVWKSRFLQ